MFYKPIRPSSYCIAVFVIAALVHAQPRSVRQDAKKSPESQSSKVDVCKLLTSAEIQNVQGVEIVETKLTAQPSGGLLFTQCLFRTSAPAKSVSIALASQATAKPRDYWHKQFSAKGARAEHESGEEKGKRGRAEHEKDSAETRAIKGVGDEAYWLGGPISGALYVLHANTFIRISIGGVREESVRIQKSIALARAALKRL